MVNKIKLLLLFNFLFVLILSLTACNNSNSSNTNSSNDDLVFYNFENISYYETFLGDEDTNLSSSQEYYLYFFTNRNLSLIEENGGTEYIDPYIVEPVGENADNIAITSDFRYSEKQYADEADADSLYYVSLIVVNLDFSESYSYTDELVEINNVRMNVFGELYDAPVNIKVHLVSDDLTSKLGNVQYCANGENASSGTTGSAVLSSGKSESKFAYKSIYINAFDGLEINSSLNNLKVYNSNEGLGFIGEYYDLDINNLTDSGGDYIYCYDMVSVYVYFDIDISVLPDYCIFTVPIYAEIYIQDSDKIVTVPIGLFTYKNHQEIQKFNEYYIDTYLNN